MHVDHPYKSLHGGRWLRGNLHAHTTRSDGQSTPQAVVDAYADLGYGFLMLSDHDIVHTSADLAALNSRGLILIPGYEITANGVHMLHVNAGKTIHPHADRQRVLRAANKVARSFIVVNHPNWHADFDHCTYEQLSRWQGYLGIEIYNGVIERLEGSPLATDHWDRLLSSGRKVWGFANDDRHRAGESGLAWNVAYVTRPTVAGVVAALRAGRFYASTGVSISNITVASGHISLQSPDADRIIMYGKHQRRLAAADGQSLRVPFPPDEPYVRFACLGRGGRSAWTQPFFRAK